MIVEIRALLGGQFRRSRNINDIVQEEDVIGRIFRQGVMNNQITTSAGVITFLAEENQQVNPNSVICRVDDDAVIPMVAGMPAAASLSTFAGAAKKAAKKATKKSAKKKAAKKKVAAKKKTAVKKTGGKKKAAKKAATKSSTKSAKKASSKKSAASKKAGSKKKGTARKKASKKGKRNS